MRGSCGIHREDEFNLDQSDQGDRDPSAADDRSARDASKPSLPPPPRCNSRTPAGRAENVLAVFYSGRVKSSSLSVQHFQYFVSLSPHTGRLKPACPGTPPPLPFLPPLPHSVSSRHSWPSGDVGVNLNRTAVTSGANTCSHSSLYSTRQTPPRPPTPEVTVTEANSMFP